MTKSKDEESIINKAGRSTYPKRKSVLRTEATRGFGASVAAPFAHQVMDTFLVRDDSIAASERSQPGR